MFDTVIANSIFEQSVDPVEARSGLAQCWENLTLF